MVELVGRGCVGRMRRGWSPGLAMWIPVFSLAHDGGRRYDVAVAEDRSRAVMVVDDVSVYYVELNGCDVEIFRSGISNIVEWWLGRRFVGEGFVDWLRRQRVRPMYFTGDGDVGDQGGGAAV